MINVWVVRGAKGEYSDHSEWIVAMYTSEEMATIHLDRLQKFEYPTEGGADDWVIHQRMNEEIKGTLDPNNEAEYGDIPHYWINSFKVFSHFDEFLENLQ